jgi:hypothetical protein
MARFLVERRLREVSARLRSMREELAVLEEQGMQLNDEADDHRLRALVSETPIADVEFRDAQRHADAFAHHKADIVASIAKLEARQDKLLDELSSR